MSQQKERERYEGRFCLETEEWLVLTGASGVSAGKSRGETLWLASIDLAAWRAPGEEMCEQRRCLSAQVDDGGLKAMQKTLEADHIYRVTVRRSKEGGAALLLAGEVLPGADPALEALLARRLTPVYYDHPALGRLTLGRTVNWFEGAAQWMGRMVDVYFDQGGQEEMADSARTLCTLLDHQGEWNRRVLEKASQELLALKNDAWLGDGEDPLTEEAFHRRMRLESIEGRPEGVFTFWFDDGDLFWGHAIVVSGTLDRGPQDAEIMG